MKVNTFIIALLRLYKCTLSPMLPPSCRFTPTCSEYAMEAFQKKGPLKALWMTVVRISKCHPFHRGGYDPVDPVRKLGSVAAVNSELTRSSSDSTIHARPH